ncbi:MAG: hypothetical protein ACYC8S_02250 [Minisyncoccota bacterium]
MERRHWASPTPEETVRGFGEVLRGALSWERFVAVPVVAEVEAAQPVLAVAWADWNAQRVLPPLFLLEMASRGLLWEVLGAIRVVEVGVE